MTDKSAKDMQSLRKLAESRLDHSQDSESAASVDKSLLHELQVHQIELEMQNEQMRQVQAALEKSRDRYVDLYEFAPVGYLSISTQGMIDALNLKAASMLGIERKQLIKQIFEKLVTDDTRDYWRRQFTWMKSLSSGEEHDF